MGENLLPKKLLVFYFTIGLLLIPAVSLADVINPAGDTYVDEFAPAANYGAAAVLNVGFQDLTDEFHRCRTFLKFDLSGIPANSVIISAVLEMEVAAYDSTMSPTAVALHNVYPVSWDELTLNWTQSPNNSAGIATTPAAIEMISTIGIYNWVVTADVITAFNSVGSYQAMLKVVDDEFVAGQRDFVQFRSRESGTPANLTITYSAPSADPSTPVLEGYVHVIKITEKLEPYHDTTLLYGESDDHGNPNEHRRYQGEDPTNYTYTNKIIITYTDKLFIIGRPVQVDCDPGTGDEPSTSATFEYDSLGRLVRALSNPLGSGADSFTELYLSYDIPGNLNTADVTYENGSFNDWTLEYDSDDNIFNRVYEKKDNTIVPPLYSGQVDYFLVNNANQLLYKTIPGAFGAANNYNYDGANRLTLISNGSPLREYLYDENSMLQEYTNYQNNDFDSALTYSYDALSRLIKITSQTNISAPESVLLGQLALSYYDNDTLNEVGYSTDEDTSNPVKPIYSTNYSYDGLDRRLTAEYLSHDPNIPDIKVIMNPDAPDGDYMVTQYIYDNFGRLAWTVHSNGYVSRTIYNQGPGLEEKKMVQIHMEEPTEMYLTSFEHNAAGDILRTTDLAGHFTQHDNDSNGNSFGSYVLGTSGGGGSNSGAYGQVFQMSAYSGFNSPLLDDILRFEFDQYGDFGIVIQEGNVGINGAGIGTEATKKKILKKLSKNKNKTKNNPAKDNQKGCTETVIGDHNGDCKNNLLDFAIFCNWWLTDKSK